MILCNSNVLAQDDVSVEKHLWAMTLLNFRIDDRWSYNQDLGYQHSFETPTFNRIVTRSQINRQLNGTFSLHGGFMFLFKVEELTNDVLEIRPWAGAKMRWPYFWRFYFVQYLRFEQRFEHTMGIDEWENNFRVRYKVSSNVPVNHESLTDKTIYAVMAYEFLSVSFADELRFTTAATHRVDLGMGYRQNSKNSFEATLIALNGLAEDNGHYSLSTGVLFLKYKRFINRD